MVMNNSPFFSSRVLGSTAIGFAVIIGAYIITSHQKETGAHPVNNVTQEAAVSARSPIPVTDNDNNGIEDWRDDLVGPDFVLIEEGTSTEYVEPTTITGQTGIHLVEGLIYSNMYGSLGSSKDELVNDTANTLERQAGINLYHTSDINIMSEWEDEDIVNYANSLAAIMIGDSDESLDYELDILYDLTHRGDKDRLEDLEKLTKVYRAYRDDTLKLPVPKIFAKEHLDVINTYEAIWEDLDAMIQVYSDPLLALIYLNRYKEDANGLYYAMQNMYTTLAEYASLFSQKDPALYLVTFSPDYTSF